MAKHRILLLFLSLAAFSLGLASYMTAGLIPLIAEIFPYLSAFQHSLSVLLRYLMALFLGYLLD